MPFHIESLKDPTRPGHKMYRVLEGSRVRSSFLESKEAARNLKHLLEHRASDKRKRHWISWT